MDSLTHFHSKNVHFYTHYSNSLKVTALDMFLKKLVDTPLKPIYTESSVVYIIILIFCILHTFLERCIVKLLG